MTENDTTPEPTPIVCEFLERDRQFKALSESVRVELEAAVAASESIESGANAYIKEKISDITPDEAHIDLDMSGTSWEFLFQDIVRRSKTLRYVTAITSFTCSKMRPDGFGGMAVLITADTVKGKSTHEIIEDFLAEEGIAP